VAKCKPAIIQFLGKPTIFANTNQAVG